MDNKRMRIVSDGSPHGTKVFDASGQPMDMRWVAKVEWSIEAGRSLGTATITIANVEVELVGEARDMPAEAQ